MRSVAVLFLMAGALHFAPLDASAACGENALCPGDRIDKSNLDAALSQDFDGTPVAELMPESLNPMIRDFNLAIVLETAKPLPRDRRHAAATERNRGVVKLDPETKRVLNWTAGAPFPDIVADDPDAGWKVAWNQFYGTMRGDNLNRSYFAWILVDGKTGLERIQDWGFKRMWMKGRYGLDRPGHISDGSIYYKSLTVATGPQDIKGIGTLTIRYDTGQVDDSWAYIRDVRRVRRLSGGSWMDPIGSTDWLNDDFDIFGAYPTWYRDYKLVGKAKQLVLGHSDMDLGSMDAETPQGKFATFNLTDAPYWNPTETWEARDVYIVEAVTPDGHPYSRKIGYFDAGIWQPYHGFTFDRQGSFNKWIYQVARVWPTADDPEGFVYWSHWGGAADVQKVHGTLFGGPIPMVFNGPLSEDEVSLSALETAGK